jgi:hypothetical protein
VLSMWLGVIEESSPSRTEELLGKSPSKLGSEFMIALHNHGKLILHKIDHGKCDKTKANISYSSGSILEFELNYSKGKLKVTIDGILRCTVSSIHGLLRPYICMERNESAKIILQACIPRSEVPPSIQSADLIRGLDNCFWSNILDSEIKSLCPAEGEFKVDVKEGFEFYIWEAA